MNNFKHFITPEEAAKLHNKSNPDDKKSIEYFRQLSRDKSLCEVCGVERVWRFVGAGMCFSCITGEADASGDYELYES